MAWLGNWRKRVKLSVDQSKVDAALSNFPLTALLDTSSGLSARDLGAIFSDLGSNSLKIAIAASDGTTQCYVEVERWDNSGNNAVLHFRALSISDSTDEDFYLYWDPAQPDNTAYVGAVTSTPGRAVWDSDYAAVYHLHNDPSGGSGAIKDSTANARHGTSTGSMTSGDVVGGRAGKGLDFDGANDGITLTDIDITSQVTLEACIYPRDTTADPDQIVSKRTNTDASPWISYLLTRIGSTQRYSMQANIGGSVYGKSLATGISLNAWCYLAGVYDGSYVRMYSQGAAEPSPSAATGSMATSDRPVTIAYNYYGREYANAIIDEVRISSTGRSAAWIKATYHSLWDTLITYSAPEILEIEDVTLNLSLVAWSYEDLAAALRAHDGLEFEDLAARLEAADWIVEDLAAALAAYWQEREDWGVSAALVASQIEDLALALEARGVSREDLALLLHACGYAREDLGLLLEIVSRLVLEDARLCLAATDGAVREDLGLSLSAIAPAPYYRTVTAQRVRSVITEVD